MQTPRNEFACKFQGKLLMGQKVIIRCWWESGLSSASRNHLTTFCRPFAHYACLSLCSAIVHFIQNNCLYSVCYGFAKTLVWKTWMWRQIMTSQTTHTKYKWHHTPLNELPPWKCSAYATDPEQRSNLSRGSNGSDTCFANEVERKIQILPNMLLQRALEQTRLLY